MNTEIIIAGKAYAADVAGRLKDRTWDDRECLVVTCRMEYEQIKQLFPAGVAWAVHTVPEPNDPGDAVEQTFDKSAYRVPGPITDNRDGTCTIKMGMPSKTERIQNAEAKFDELREKVKTLTGKPSLTSLTSFLDFVRRVVNTPF